MNKIILLLIISVNVFAQNTANLINGVFVVNQTKYYDAAGCNSNQLKTVNNIAAYFTYTPSAYIKPSDFNKAGNVKFNNNPLDYNNSGKFYSETEVNNISQQNWKVSGHSTIPNMNFIYNGILPNFTINQSFINDTLKKSDTLFIHINNIQNTDSIMIRISDNQQLSSQHHVALLAPNYSNTYYLPPTIFGPLVIGPKAVITIDAIKYNYQTVSGKRFLFRNIYSYVRTDVKIIN